MIIGTNYAFVAVSKVASVSLRSALRNNTAIVVEHSPLDGKNIKGLEQFKNSHVTIDMARAHVDLDGLLTCAFVRNPFDRFVSACAWSPITFKSQMDDVTFQSDPRKYMDLMIRFHGMLRETTTHVWGQHEFLDSNMGFIGRFENLQSDYDELCNLLGVTSMELPKQNRSNHSDYRTYYNNELIDKVSALYEVDLIRFRYSFE